MSTYLSKESIKIDFSAVDWVDAVLESGNLLVKAGVATPDYCNALVEMVKKYGAYMLVTDGVAMPHAQSHKGVIKNGISFLRLKKAVNFPDREDNPISVLIAVAAKDNDSHLQAMARVAEALTNDETVNFLKICGDADEVMKIFNF